MEKQDFINSIKEIIESGNYIDANILIREYKDLFGSNEEIESIEAITNIYLGNYDKALKCIKQGLRNNIFSSDLYYTMGNVFELKEEYNKAYICYEYALYLCNKEENRSVILSSINEIENNYKIDVKKISIVILTHNQLEYTKLCINSIRNYNSPETYEIIIVDNASTDGTKEWLQAQKDIKVVFNDDNKGFPAGCNQGILVSEKENDILLLNNDTVIMPNSILNMRLALYSKENIGATGAVSNSVSYYQQIEENFETFDGYMNYALVNNIADSNRYEERLKLVGFAMLIKKDVLNKVGLLDERFTPGNFEDDDISLRIILEGYKLLLCRDSYIHHFGSVTFKKDKEGYSKLLNTNSNKFKEKWGFSCEESTIIRYDLINLINEDKKNTFNLLQIGCDSGATLLEIKNRYPNCNIFALESNECNARIAQKIANVQNEIHFEKNMYSENSFDYVLLGNILEKVINPEELLKIINSWLKPNGYLIANINNIMHYSIIRDLINGFWSYKELGILSKRNIKFFTKNEIIKIIGESGYYDIQIGNVQGYKTNEDDEFIDKLSSLSLIDVKNEFSVYQYLVKARKYYDITRLIKKCTYLLRRIEFDIDINETEIEIIENLLNNTFTENIIIEAIEKNIIRKVYILNYVAIKCFENNLFDRVIPLLKYAYKLEPQNIDTNYNLAYLLNVMGEKEIALTYLDNLNESNREIEELKARIRGDLLE